MEKNKTKRILASPVIFVYGIFVTFALTFFPLGMATGIGIYNNIMLLIIYLTGIDGKKVGYNDCLIFVNIKGKYKNALANNTICIFIVLWLPFYIAFDYIKTGEVFTLTKYHTE